MTCHTLAYLLRAFDRKGSAIMVVGATVKEKKRMRNLTIAEQPLGERRPDELRTRHHPIQWEDARHQWRHPPRVIPPDDAGPVEAMGLQEHDGHGGVAHPLLLLDGWPLRP